MNKMKIIDYLGTQIRKNKNLTQSLPYIAHRILPDRVVALDYPINSKQRWTLENPHQELYDIIKRSSATYKYHLISFLPFIDYLISIPKRHSKDSLAIKPSWINGSMPALDGVALYCFIAINKPKYFIEVGSGNSTNFARKAITDHRLNTKIISIDPCPRISVDNICDEIIRKPVENVSLDIFNRLDVNDILYIDNSHRTFMNSDATVLLIDVLPRLKPGVLVEIHDVYLPYDYPVNWIDRYYSEQYLLAAYLLAKGNRFNIILPNTFISNDSELKSILAPLWEKSEMKNMETHGGSFWIQTK